MIAGIGPTSRFNIRKQCRTAAHGPCDAAGRRYPIEGLQVISAEVLFDQFVQLLCRELATNLKRLNRSAPLRSASAGSMNFVLRVTDISGRFDFVITM